MAHIHNVFDAEPRYTIDSVTREISNKDNSKEVIVQGDHNSERFAFEIPRYIDAHDMSLCNRVQVHFINIGPNTARIADVYPVDDLQIDPENTEQVICSWLISSRATTYAGSLNFVLRFMCVNSDGLVEYSWSTTPYTGVTVSSSIVNSDEVANKYASDILESWYQSLISTGAEGVNIVEQAKNDAIAEIDRHTSSFYRDSANAFKRTVTGKVVRVDDVSPIQHYAKVYARGKNLAGALHAGLITNVDCNIVDDGTNIYRSLKTYLRAGTYTLSFSKAVNILRIVNSGRYTQSYVEVVTKYTFVTTVDGYVGFSFRDAVASTEWSDRTIQIEEGDTATEYEPYIDPTNLAVTTFGKNLFDLNTYVEKYKSQITAHTSDSFTLKHLGEDGQIFVNASLLLGFDNAELEGKHVTVSGEWTPSSQNKGAIRVQWYSPTQGAVGSIAAVTDTSGKANTGTIPPKPCADAQLIVYIYVNTDGPLTKGDTITYRNVQVEFGDTATPYEAFKSGAIHQPDEDGTCSVTSLSPTMTVSVDGGAIIDLEYNRDTNVVMGDIGEALDRIIAIQEAILGGAT